MPVDFFFPILASAKLLSSKEESFWHNLPHWYIATLLDAFVGEVGLLCQHLAEIPSAFTPLFPLK